MGYHDLSGRPWEVMTDWVNALSGGKQTMQLAGPVPSETCRLSCRRQWQLDLTPHGGGTNPAICAHAGGLLVAVRRGGRNLLGRLDGEALVDVQALHGKYAPHEREGNPCRPFSFKGKLYATVPVADYGTAGIPPVRVGLIEIDPTTGAIPSLWAYNSDRYEKNWMVCADGSELSYVYSTDPLIVLRPPYGVPSTFGGSVLRGGTHLVRAREGAWPWLAVVHSAHKTDAGHVYVNRFVSFRSDLGAAHVGRPFYLHALGVEITGGLAMHDGRVLLSYGRDEREAWLAEVDLDHALPH